MSLLRVKEIEETLLRRVVNKRIGYKEAKDDN